ncbi:restriction endonuclease subunit S [Streptomyces sp. NPDC102437]|uniref:restriction endonuclease subunit S n=1 Tax=Streptomyces sp. NPDC102437 TaxID=3366175 RepID=UPI00382259F2
MTSVPGLGNIPAEWASERARWLLHRQRRDVRPSDGIVTAFRDGQVTLRDNRRIEGFTNAVHEIGYQGIRVGDLVVHGMDGFAGAIGVSDSDGKSSPVVHAYTPSTSSDVRFLAYALRTMAISGYVGTLAKGIRERSTAFDASTLADVSLPVPPLEEQRRIADFLDAETARISKLVAAKDKVSDLIDERRVALTSQLCLKGLDSNTPMRNSGIDPLGSVPAHWTVTRNKNILREITDLSVDGSEELLTVSHLTGVTPRSEKTVYMFEAESVVGYKICRPGDLVINTLWAWMGALGASNYDGIVSPAYGVYRFTSDDGVPEYFDLLYRTPEYVCEMTRFSKGVWSSRLRLYPDAFLALGVAVPPRNEQRAIVQAVEREVSPGLKMQEMIRTSNALLAERRQALITAAVTGQFDVSTASGRNVTDGVHP